MKNVRTNRNVAPLKPFASREYVRQRAQSVIKTYYRAILSERSAGRHVGQKELPRTATPSRERPVNVLKREIYRLAFDAARLNGLRVIQSYVKKRDEKRYKPKASSAVDWAARLVAYEDNPIKNLDDPSILYHNLDRKILIHPSKLSRIIRELNFAFDHAIRWQFVDMVIDQVGGYTRIAASEAVFDTPTNNFMSWAIYLSWSDGGRWRESPGWESWDGKRPPNDDGDEEW